MGGGPAGLPAAFALRSAGHEVTIFEASRGWAASSAPASPPIASRTRSLERDLARILRLGVNARCGVAVDALALGALAAGHDAVILAAGLPRTTGLDVPGRTLEGMQDGLAFLDQVKSGGGGALRGHVVVVGGGNTAVDCARTALRCGAARVTHRLPARPRRDARHPGGGRGGVAEGVALLPHRQPVGFTGRWPRRAR